MSQGRTPGDRVRPGQGVGPVREMMGSPRGTLLLARRVYVVQVGGDERVGQGWAAEATKKEASGQGGAPRCPTGSRWSWGFFLKVMGTSERFWNSRTPIGYSRVRWGGVYEGIKASAAGRLRAEPRTRGWGYRSPLPLPAASLSVRVGGALAKKG